MKQLILMFALFVCSFAGYSQEKGSASLSTLSISSTENAINVSSPSITYFFFNNMGITLGMANFDDITVGAKYYVKDNNFAFAGYGTGSESLDLGLGKTYKWKDHVNVEPRLTFSDVLNDEINLGLSLHLNLVF